MWRDTIGNSRAGTHVQGWVSLILKSVCFIPCHVFPLRLGADGVPPRSQAAAERATGPSTRPFPLVGLPGVGKLSTFRIPSFPRCPASLLAAEEGRKRKRRRCQLKQKMRAIRKTLKASMRPTYITCYIYSRGRWKFSREFIFKNFLRDTHAHAHTHTRTHTHMHRG